MHIPFGVGAERLNAISAGLPPEGVAELLRVSPKEGVLRALDGINMLVLRQLQMAVTDEDRLMVQAKALVVEDLRRTLIDWENEQRGV